jgi:Immunoglobulin I-set domain.
VKWFKERRELSKYEFNMTHSDGLVAMEIVDCKPEDSGKYHCVATNIHGTDETSCVVIVEGKTIINSTMSQIESHFNNLRDFVKVMSCNYNRLFVTQYTTYLNI